MSFFFIGCNIFLYLRPRRSGVTFVQDAGLYHQIAAKKSLAFKNISNGPMIALEIHNKNFISMHVTNIIKLYFMITICIGKGFCHQTTSLIKNK